MAGRRGSAPAGPARRRPRRARRARAPPVRPGPSRRSRPRPARPRARHPRELPRDRRLADALAGAGDRDRRQGVGAAALRLQQQPAGAVRHARVQRHGRQPQPRPLRTTGSSHRSTTRSAPDARRAGASGRPARRRRRSSSRSRRSRRADGLAAQLLRAAEQQRARPTPPRGRAIAAATTGWVVLAVDERDGPASPRPLAVIERRERELEDPVAFVERVRARSIGDAVVVRPRRRCSRAGPCRAVRSVETVPALTTNRSSSRQAYGTCLWPDSTRWQPRADQHLEGVAGVVDDVALAPRAGDRQQVVVEDEDPQARRLRRTPRGSTRTAAADEAVVEVGLRRVDREQADAVLRSTRCARAEQLLEVDVADVARVVVAGHDDQVAASIRSR